MQTQSAHFAVIIALYEFYKMMFLLKWLMKY